MKLEEAKLKRADIICSSIKEREQVEQILLESGERKDRVINDPDGLIVGLYPTYPYDVTNNTNSIFPQITGKEFIASNTPPCPTN
jgi:hypothetical protein